MKSRFAILFGAALAIAAPSVSFAAGPCGPAGNGSVTTASAAKPEGNGAVINANGKAEGNGAVIGASAKAEGNGAVVTAWGDCK